MFTPEVTRQRKNLRQAVNDAFPAQAAMATFERIAQRRAFISPDDIEPFCEKIRCPAASLENIFAPYGVRSLLITRAQWVAFMQDDFPQWQIPELGPALNDRQAFLLTKFLASLRTKFGGTLRQRWSAALARNPPNTLNTTLRVSALCRLFECTNLPFAVSDFVDALFVFLGERVEGITFHQFCQFLNAFP
jgi:hypothetical protein